MTLRTLGGWQPWPAGGCCGGSYVSSGTGLRETSPSRLPAVGQGLTSPVCFCLTSAAESAPPGFPSDCFSEERSGDARCGSARLRCCNQGPATRETVRYCTIWALGTEANKQRAATASAAPWAPRGTLVFPSPSSPPHNAGSTPLPPTGEETEAQRWRDLRRSRSHGLRNTKQTRARANPAEMACGSLSRHLGATEAGSHTAQL